MGKTLKQLEKKVHKQSKNFKWLLRASKRESGHRARVEHRLRERVEMLEDYLKPLLEWYDEVKVDYSATAFQEEDRPEIEVQSPSTSDVETTLDTPW